MERTPWEKLLYGSNPIEGERTCGRILENLIAEAKNCRRALSKKWGDKANTYTLQKMAEEVAKDLKELIKHERGFQTDAKFLFDHAASVAVKISWTSVLSFFPEQDTEAPDMDKAIAGVRTVRQSALVMRSDKKLRNDLHVLIELLLKAKRGNGPNAGCVESESP